MPFLPSSHHSKATAGSPSQSYPWSAEDSALPNTESESRRGLRARSSTSPDRHLSASFSNRVRSRTDPQSIQPPLHLRLPVNPARVPRAPATLQTLAESPSEKPSAPIDIPLRKKAEVSRPTTPLTARAPQGEYFTAWQKTDPRISESLTPNYSSRAKSNTDGRNSSATRRGSTPMSSRPDSFHHRPSSPLSPKMSSIPSSIDSSQKARMPAQSLNLAKLPKYHPANFSSKGSSPASSSPLSSRSLTSQPRPGRGSDAKQQLLQYQRDLIHNTAKASRTLLSPGVSSKPSPPRLNPLGSPGGPMTPFMLEDASDYLVARYSALPAGSEDGEAREFVERLVRRENERRNYPESRPGSVSPALSSSSAVSPAGGRG